ncbi:MAG: thioredoxin family protein [Alistipes sp.]
MKKILLVLLLLLSTGSLTAQVTFETSSTDTVRAKAEKAGKLVFIDLYATWCPPCRAMEQQVFSLPEVGNFMSQRFVCAKYDTDKPTGKKLLKKYGSGAIPLYLIFRTNGELVGRITGGAAAKEFMSNIESMLARSKTESAASY